MLAHFCLEWKSASRGDKNYGIMNDEECVQNLTLLVEWISNRMDGTERKLAHLGSNQCSVSKMVRKGRS